ncbi:hypothetical protein CE91St26_02380 [Akkermansia muciniphila]|nr:hypothetical protein CE91St26_02380 [Akkermansia muciniphila]GKI08156.1 hypothetical protein CE91St27_02380 [Akkermansia muciniphila]
MERGAYGRLSGMEGFINSGMEAMDMAFLKRRRTRITERAASRISRPQDRIMASHAAGVAREGATEDRHCRNRVERKNRTLCSPQPAAAMPQARNVLLPADPYPAV